MCIRARVPGLSAAGPVLAVWVLLTPDLQAQGLPQGGVVSAGQATISSPRADQLTITQGGSRAVIDWTSFNIDAGHSVRFVQPDRSAQVLNRVVGTDSSQIHGQLTANGQVFLVNPHGIVFGQGAVVDVGGLIASTRDVDSQAFMAGCQSLAFSGAAGGGGGAGLVRNEGSLRSLQGYVVLHGTQVENHGRIEAAGGQVALAAGGRATVALANGQLIHVSLDEPATAALLRSDGLIHAPGGRVLLSARSADAVLDQAINLSGVVDVSAAPGGQAGTVRIDGHSHGVVNLSAVTVDAHSVDGSGGCITVTGERVGLFNGTTLDARGAGRGGDVRIGGGVEGRDPTIAHARMTVVDERALIDVSASGAPAGAASPGVGSGGTVVLWSDEYTAFHGRIRARGAAGGGDGGWVETSSADNLQAWGRVDAAAPQGRAGHWLLDPTDVTISGAASANASASGGVWTVSNASATISNASINADLNAGTSVTITTTSGGTGTGVIRVNGDITKTAGENATLTLNANAGLNLSANLTSSHQALNVNLTAPGGIVINNAHVDLNGGLLRGVGGQSGASVDGVRLIGNLTVAGDSRVELTGISGVSAGIRQSGGNLTQTGIGTLNLTGTSTSAAGVIQDAGLLAQRGDGSLNLRGTTSTSSYGVMVSGGGIQQSGNGSLTVDATSNTNNAFRMSVPLVQSGAGTLNISGTANASTSVAFVGATVTQSGAGRLNMVGRSNTSSAVNLMSNSTLVQSGAGSWTITGTTNAATSQGIYFTGNSSLIQSGAGSMNVSGTAVGGAGVELFAGPITQSGNGSLAFNGFSGSLVGVILWSGATLSQSGAGNLSLNGATTSGTGVTLSVNASINQTGAGILSFTGNATSGTGLGSSNTTIRQMGAGTLNLTGVSTGGTGISLSPNTTLAQSAAGRVTVNGVSTWGRGLFVNASTLTQNSSGTMIVAGESNGGDGVLINTGAAIAQTGTGSLLISGRSNQSVAVNLSAGSLAQSGGGTLTVSGTSNHASGIDLRGTAVSQGGAGTMNLSGRGRLAGIRVTAGSVGQAGPGLLSLGGSSDAGVGVSLGGGVLTQTGNGAVEVNGRGGGASDAVRIAGLSMQTVNLSLAGTQGAVNVSSALNVSGHLQFDAAGSGHDVMAFHPANRLTGLVTVNQAGAVNLTNGGTLRLGAVSADGPITVSTQQGDLRLDGDVVSQAGDLTLIAALGAPAGTAIGADAYGDVVRGDAGRLTAGTGATVIIHWGNADTVGATGLGGLIAATAHGTTDVNKFYATNLSAGPGIGQIDPAAALNVFYRVSPTLHVAGNLSKVYGTDDPDLVPAVTGFIDGDSATSLPLSGNPGRVVGESVGPHALTVGSLSGRGYGFVAEGSLTITPAAVTVTVADQQKPYGTDDPTLTYTAGAPIRTTVQSHTPGGSMSSVAIDDSALTLVVGNLGREPGEAVGGRSIFNADLSVPHADYQLGPVLNGTLQITPATLTVTAGDVSKVAGQADPILPYTVAGAIHTTVDSVDEHGVRQAITIDDRGLPLVDGSLTRVPGEAPGSLPILVGSLSSTSANYQLALPITAGSLIITPAPDPGGQGGNPPGGGTHTGDGSPGDGGGAVTPGPGGTGDGQSGTPGPTGDGGSSGAGGTGAGTGAGTGGGSSGVTPPSMPAIDPGLRARLDAMGVLPFERPDEVLRIDAPTPGRIGHRAWMLPTAAGIALGQRISRAVVGHDPADDGLRLPDDGRPDGPPVTSLTPVTPVTHARASIAPGTPDVSGETDRSAGGAAAPPAIRLRVDLMFRFDRADAAGLLPSARQALARFVERLQARGLLATSIDIDGHADRLGTAAVNERLSLARAETVRRLLADLGVTGGLRIRAHGARTPQVVCEPTAALIACLAPNRRVTVEALDP